MATVYTDYQPYRNNEPATLLTKLSLSGQRQSYSDSFSFATERGSAILRKLLLLLLLISLGPHGSTEVPWRRFFDDTRMTDIERRFGDDGVQRVLEMKTFIEGTIGEDITAGQKLEAVNAFFNRVPFVSDQEHWGQPDYWATPLEFVASGGGDCEDFSIAKFFVLRVFGVPAEELRLMYAKALSLNQAHMVLLYLESPDAMPKVLDNLNGEVLPGNERPDLVPVYSFNGEGLWRARAFDKGVRLKRGESGVDLWQDLVVRMSIEVGE